MSVENIIKNIHIQSPTRVDLAGGTLDMWPLYNFVDSKWQGQVCTINVAIDIYTDVQIQTGTSQIILESKDIQLKAEFANLESLLSSSDNKLSLYQSVILYFQKPLQSYFKQHKGFHLITSSQSPVGGGLGGSSSLMISLLKSFAKLCQFQFKDNHHMVQVAHNLEASLLRTPTGTQDYYPAVSGGINLLSYSPDGIQQKILPVNSNSYLEKHFLLVYTGKSHHSGINNFEVLKKAVTGDQRTLAALNRVAKVAVETSLVIQSEDYTKLPDLFEQEFQARKDLAESFASPEILKLHQISQENKGLGLKICGAGGGGCVLLLVKPEDRNHLITAIQNNGFQVLPTKPVTLL